MEKATITEVKNHLSAFLDRVRQGEVVLITDRGRPVARLESVLSEPGVVDLDGRLARLERSGLVRRARNRPQAVLSVDPSAPQNGLSLLKAVLAERETNR